MNKEQLIHGFEKNIAPILKAIESSGIDISNIKNHKIMTKEQIIEKVKENIKTI